MKRQATRDIIVQTASKLFYEKGYNLTGINEVIAEAGIAKATLYSHFRSKEDLCIAYLEEKDTVSVSQLKAFCEDKPKGKARLIAVIEYLIPFFESKEFNGCWCIRTIAEIPRENEKIRAVIQQQKRNHLNYIRSLVKENTSKLSAKNKEQLAKRIYLLYEGAVAESHLHNDTWPIYESIDLLKSVLKLVDGRR